eukprot:3089413-Pyramimonas_sp.AAC.1
MVSSPVPKAVMRIVMRDDSDNHRHGLWTTDRLLLTSNVDVDIKTGNKRNTYASKREILP